MFIGDRCQHYGSNTRSWVDRHTDTHKPPKTLVRTTLGTYSRSRGRKLITTRSDDVRDGYTRSVVIAMEGYRRVVEWVPGRPRTSRKHES